MCYCPFFLFERNAIIDRQMALQHHTHLVGSVVEWKVESTLCTDRILPAHRPEAFYLSLSQKIKNSKNEEGVIWKKTSYLLCSQLARKS
jgi:hypothetical protein